MVLAAGEEQLVFAIPCKTAGWPQSTTKMQIKQFRLSVEAFESGLALIIL